MPDKADNTVSTVKYRCVCGEDAVVHVVDGGRCENCGRDISAEMLRSNVSQTIEIDGSGSVGSAARSGSGGLTLDPADDLAGETLGYFQIIEALGHGGMGSVYRALDESLQRYVALKVIKKANTSSADLDHLLQEAPAQAHVNHPNVVHIYYVSRGEERPFLAMELVNGPTLAQRTRKEKLAYAEVLRIAIETTMALQQSRGLTSSTATSNRATSSWRTASASSYPISVSHAAFQMAPTSQPPSRVRRPIWLPRSPGGRSPACSAINTRWA